MDQTQNTMHKEEDSGLTKPGINLLELPEEILQLILSYVPARNLLQDCQRVCKALHAVIGTHSFWIFKCEEERLIPRFSGKYLPLNFNWKRFCMKEPFNRNLIRNPCGAEGLRHWHVIKGGDGWSVKTISEEDLTGIKSTFVSSFYWSEKSQTIDLIKEGFWDSILDKYQPEIVINDWFSAYKQWGGTYWMLIQLLGKNKHRVIKEYKTDIRVMETGQPLQQWDQVTHVFRDYGPGVRYIKLIHNGKDVLFWKGHFGAWVSNSSVTVRLRIPEELAMEDEKVIRASTTSVGSLFRL
ncbi:F-box only protein 2 isoform X2 [Amia ocellicauda]